MKEKRAGGRRFNIRAHGFVDIQNCVLFISNYAEDHARQDTWMQEEAVKLLPSSETKTKVYGVYKSACEEAGNDHHQHLYVKG